MSSPTSPFQDHAAPILAADPTLSDKNREDLWDAFHSKSPEELVQHLATLDIPNETKHNLWQAKQASIPAPAPLEKVAQAAARISQLDPQVRETAEAHPNLLKAFTTAATTEPKSAQEPAGASSASGKGKKTPEAPKTPLAPRADGQPHFPAIPANHHRVLGTDGSVYDVPAEHIDTARAADPNMHILNPDEG